MLVETQKQAEATVKQAAATVQQAAQTSQNGTVAWARSRHPSISKPFSKARGSKPPGSCSRAVPFVAVTATIAAEGEAYMPIAKRLAAEFLGTFWLVFGGCGSAIFAAVFLTPDNVPIGIGFAGVALAFGLTVLTGVYALGPISGGHFNPAVTVGLWVGRRFDGKDVIPYVIIQCVAAVAAAAVLYAIFSGQAGFAGTGNLCRERLRRSLPRPLRFGLGVRCRGGADVFLPGGDPGATDKRAPAGFAGLAIGLCLTLIHLVGIPITNTSVNPARSLGPALFAQGGWALGQLWLFWVAPIIGAAIAGLIYSQLLAEKT